MASAAAPTKELTKAALKKEGLPASELEFIAQRERAMNLDQEGDFPALPHNAAPPAFTEEERKNMQRWKSNIVLLQAAEPGLRDEDQIQFNQKKIDKLLGRQSSETGNCRFGARLHTALGTLQSWNANEVDQLTKEQKAAERNLDEAKARVNRANEALTCHRQTFERREERITALLEHHGVKKGDPPPQPTPQPQAPQSLDPALLSTTMSNSIARIREQHGLVGVETPELKAINHFCSMFITEQNMQLTCQELNQTAQPPFEPPVPMVEGSGDELELAEVQVGPPPTGTRVPVPTDSWDGPPDW